MADMQRPEEQEFQQVDYEESGEEPQDDYQNHDFLNSDHSLQGNNNNASDAHNNGRRVLPPDENGDIIVPNVLFVSRFKLGAVNEMDVKRHFDRYGPIRSVVIRYKVAFVEFEHDEDAKRAKHDAHFKAGLGSDSLIVDFRKDNKVKPRPEDRFLREGELPRPKNSSHQSHPPLNDDRYGPPPSHSDRGRGPPPDRRYDERYPPNDPYPSNNRHDYYPDDRYGRPPIDRPDSRGNPPPNYHRDNRGPPPVDYPPAKYGPPPGYADDRKGPPPAYQNHPPSYRESRGPPPAGYGSVPPDYGRSGPAPGPYDDRRGPPGPYPAPKRPYDSMNDYPPYNPPPVSRGVNGPPPSRGDYPPPSSSRPYSDRPPVDLPPNRGGVELSTYAAGASRHREWVDDGNYKGRIPPDVSRGPPPAGNVGYPPNRYEEPPRPLVRGDYPPMARDAGYNNDPYRGGGSGGGIDNYQSKRARY